MHKAILILVAIIGLSNALKSQQEAPLGLRTVASNTPSFIITDPAEVLQHVGELITVQGCVVSTKLVTGSPGRPLFLNMFEDYPHNLFTLVIWGDDQDKLLGESDFSQKVVRVSGHLKESKGQGRPTISLRHPNQIQILGDCK